MSCKHEHLRTVGFDWFCADCGEQIDPAKLFGKPAKEEQPAEPAPVTAEQAENPPAEEKTGKSPAKKTTARKAVKKG